MDYKVKLYTPFVLFLLFGYSAFAQIDNKQEKYLPITLGDVPKKADSALFDTQLTPSKPINSANKVNGLTIPQSVTVKPNNKEFSMFPNEEFGNPAELYQDRVDRQKQAVESIVKMDSDVPGSTEDVVWGKLKTKSNYVIICYRDYGSFDGDYVRIFVNRDIIEPSYMLNLSYKKLKIDLQLGDNIIDFIALNEGLAPPNTGELVVVDEFGNILSDNLWGLRTNVKATLVIEKE